MHFGGLKHLEQNHLKLSDEFNFPIGEIEWQTRYPIPNPVWSVAPLNHLMKSPCQAFGAVLLHFRCICCAAQHVRANLIPQAGVQLLESQRTNVSTPAAYQKLSHRRMQSYWENGLACVSTSSCCQEYWSLFLLVYMGFYAFVFLSTVLRCLDSHLSSKWTRFRLLSAYAVTQQTEFDSPFCLVPWSKPKQLPWLGHAKCMQGKKVKFNLPK